ncbi:MAG: hypothetical protein HY923_10935 [Elusimicrobia bacterium]|nr:hypothetical protein [Elusimicrobiota bacterium]
MNIRGLALLAALISAPSFAAAGGALGDARGTAQNPGAFDGSKPRPEGDVVTVGSTGYKRTQAQVAADEQILADKRAALTARTVGADKELDPPKPNEWTKKEHFISGIKGGILGLLIGSLFGGAGLLIGVLAGGLIGYGMSRFAAKD